MKYKILILTIILLLFTTAVSAQEKPIANAENISQISIGSTSMFMDQHEKYNLNIYYPETKYIAYRINSISGDQKRITPVSDGNSLMITVNYSNGEQFIFSVEPYGISINSDLGYVIQKADYNRFLNLLEAVKKNKLSLPQTLDFEPSEWAYSAVVLSTKAGVLLGDSNKRFMPKIFVTKEEAVEALYRILTLQN